MLPFRLEATKPSSRRAASSSSARRLLPDLPSATGCIAAEPAMAQSASAAAAANPFQAYVEITPENKVVIHSSQFEMGQGSYFGIATLVMEELDGDWAQVDVVGGAGNPALYGNLAWGGVMQGTGGSTSMTSSWERYRKAGAAARDHAGGGGGEELERSGRRDHGCRRYRLAWHRASAQPSANWRRPPLKCPSRTMCS